MGSIAFDLLLQHDFGDHSRTSGDMLCHQMHHRDIIRCVQEEFVRRHQINNKLPSMEAAKHQMLVSVTI